VPAAWYYYVVSTSSAVDAQSESPSCDSSQPQPCASSTADDLGLEMSVVEVDESEDDWTKTTKC